MSLDWIPHALRTGNAIVYCKTCESKAELNEWKNVYECECEFGASIEALAFGLEGYKWEADYNE